MKLFKRFTKSDRGHDRHEIGANGQNGFGAPLAQAWEFRPLPGAGALQWAWCTLQLPRYSPIGWGTRNQRQFLATASCPVMVAVQGITLNPLQGAPVMGQMTGQFVNQPLLDIQQAQEQGFISQPAPANQYEMPTTFSGA